MRHPGVQNALLLPSVRFKHYPVSHKLPRTQLQNVLAHQDELPESSCLFFFVFRFSFFAAHYHSALTFSVCCMPERAFWQRPSIPLLEL